MAKKKKGAKGKKGKKGKVEEEDETTEKIIPTYRKKINALGACSYKPYKLKVETIIEDGEKLKEIHITEPLQVVDMQAIMEGLSDLNYKYLQEIKLVKAQTYDEGLAPIANYINKTKCVKMVNLPHNEISPIGCRLLNTALYGLKLKKLKLDFNPIGSLGLKELSNSLAQLPFLEKLSLNYCQIDVEGVKYLQQILSFINTKLWSLKLKGNYLRNDGVYQLFRALEYNKTLWRLDLSNNQFGECTEIPVIEMICGVLMKNQVCQWYDLDDNGIYDEGAKKILECVKMYKTVYKMFLPDLISKSIMDEFKKTLKKRKKKKKKSKKKSKKKKSKK